MRKTILAVLMFSVFIVIAATAFAASVMSNFTVSATVINACSVNANNIDFGNYNPASPAPKDGQGSLQLTCLAGTNYELYITGARIMTDGANNLNYELYTDAPRTSVWPSASPSPVSGATPDANPVTFDTYGRIATGQYVLAGPYSNVVAVVVAF